MRNRLFLFAATILFVACADDQHSTAPSNSRAARSGAAGDIGASGQSAINPSAKPTDQVGLTTVFTVAGNGASIDVGLGPVTVTATCPAGSQAIGGGYSIINWPSAHFLQITQFGLNAANGWSVTGWVADGNAPGINVSTTAVCIK
jgi:hypothetical protein